MANTKRTSYNKWLKITVITIVILVLGVFTFIRVKHIAKISMWTYHKVNQGIFSDVAINGYDPVAYFTEQKAVKGTSKNSIKWNGASWYFASPENLNLFKQEPEKYAPQYGGYCSFAVSTGFTANTDPEAWTIINNKLYLFADQAFKEKWLNNKDENLKKCENNWSGIK
jgi:YHS domain-containing protein